MSHGTVLALRALLSFLILPTTVAAIAPWLLLGLDEWRADGHASGYAVLTLGLVVLIWCVRDFYASGRGTLAPWDPPKRLVVAGLYRVSRNPMYVGVLTTIVGEALLFGSLVLGGYAIALAIVFHLRVVLHEEPWLRSQFGDDWERYASTVARWFPSRRRSE